VYPTIYSLFQLLTRPTPDTYTCTVFVFDPDTERQTGLADAKLIAHPGIPAETTRKTGDYEVQFRVDISKTADRASTKVSVKRGGQVVVRQSSLVRLLKTSDKGYRPAQ
jgi:hypothetical protein